MNRRTVMAALFTGILLAPQASSIAAQPQKLPQAQEQVGERVYGWELMSDEERREHRLQMRSLKTQEERERYRQEHHRKMQQRAREMGVELPEEDKVEEEF